MEEYGKNTSVHELTDTGSSDGTPSDAFNNSKIGEPITGLKSDTIGKNTKKYGIFGEEEIGGHWGRSGSPTGKKFTS